MSTDATPREQFSSRLGFLMAAAGSAIGLGNIWSFPTNTASNGGAAFVLTYLILAFLLAYPALMAELTLGRHGRANILSSLRCISRGPKSRAFASLVGGYGVLTASLILAFYAIVAGWMLAHGLAALAQLLGLHGLTQWLSSNSLWRDLGAMLVFMLLTIGIVVGGVKNGIEYWSSKLMPTLFALMLLLIGYVFTQPGANEGLRHYLVPNVAALSPELLLNAMGQAFFSLSLGVGTMLVYGSYISDKESLPQLGVGVTLLDTSIAFIAGLLIIPALFVAQHNGLSIYNDDGSLIAGPALIFNVLPSLFDSMGAWGDIAALAFFTLMTIAALTSSISMLEVPVTLLAEEYQQPRTRASLLMGGTITAASIVIILNFDALFSAVITLTTVYSQPLLGIGMCVFAGWIWQRNQLLEALRAGDPTIEQGLFWRWWPNYVQYACPLLIAAALVQSLI